MLVSVKANEWSLCYLNLLTFLFSTYMQSLFGFWYVEILKYIKFQIIQSWFLFVVGRFRVFMKKLNIGHVFIPGKYNILFILCLGRPSIIYYNRIIAIEYISLVTIYLEFVNWHKYFLLDNVSKTWRHQPISNVESRSIIQSNYENCL